MKSSLNHYLDALFQSHPSQLLSNCLATTLWLIKTVSAISSPSLQRSYLIDEIVKQSLIDDIFDIVNPPDFDKAEFLDVIS